MTDEQIREMRASFRAAGRGKEFEDGFATACEHYSRWFDEHRRSLEPVSRKTRDLHEYIDGVSRELADDARGFRL